MKLECAVYTLIYLLVYATVKNKVIYKNKINQKTRQDKERLLK